MLSLLILYRHYNNIARLILRDILRETNTTRTDKAGKAVSSFLGLIGAV